MNYPHTLAVAPASQRYLAGIGVSLAVHGLLVSLWQLSQPQRLVDETPSSSILVRLLAGPSREPIPESAREPAPQPAVRTARPAVPAVPEPAAGPNGGTQQESRNDAAPEPTVAAATPQAGDEAAPAAPAPSARELLSRAKAAAGGIDRSLRRENPQRGIVAPVETAQMKLEKGIAEAADLAPSKWYQAPKVKEIIDPGGYGRKRYRVVGARGTYCITYESNHGPDGRDSMRDGLPPKMTNCDPDEGPATIQKWNEAPAAPVRAPFRN